MTRASAGGRIGPYQIVRTIGTGGWSTVYEVVAPDGARWACKRLRDDLTPDALARFRREVESLRRIDHPGVVRLIDAGVDGAAPYLVTPLLDGTSLRAVLADGPLGVEGALAVVIAAADAVAAIHAAGLVHRDLKPENLMLTAAGGVIVIDLGLALGAEHSRHTAEDTVTGSVPYMAPEQIEDRAPSAATDVWALGVVLFEAIAGRRPFQRARQSEEVAAILAARSPSLVEMAPACPDALAALVASCLAASPAQRPADGAALATALRAHVDWTEAGGLRADRVALLSDRAAYDAMIRTHRVSLVAAEAERALAADDRFAASRAIDRGLVYAPDDPTLRALVERLMMAGGAAPRPQQVTVKGHAPAKMPIASRPPAPVAPGRPQASDSMRAGVAPVTPMPPRPIVTARPRWPWFVAGGVLVTIALGLVAAQPWRAQTTIEPDPPAAPMAGPGTASEPSASIEPPPPPAAATPDDDAGEPAPNTPDSRRANVRPSRPAPGRTAPTP